MTSSRLVSLTPIVNGGGSKPQTTPEFSQGDVVTRFRAGQIQFVRRLGVNDFLLTKLGEESNGHLHVTVREGIH